jgi:hypothetical protein
MTRWYFDPPDQLLRLITITRTAMSELGIDDPARHFIIMKFGDEYERVPATFLFKRSAFTDDEVRIIERDALSNGMRIIYTPLHRPKTIFSALIESPDPQGIWESVPPNIAPTRDDNPFFFNTLRPAHILDAFGGSDEWKKTNLGTYVLFVLLVISVVVVALFIIIPLVLARGREIMKVEGSGRFLCYFAALGAAFIVIEVALIQKFILFLGHPVYALAVVLFALLCFCGIGSGISQRVAEGALKQRLLQVLLAIAGVVVVYVFVLPPIFYGLVHLSQAARIVLSVVLLAPLALLMGMPMAMGIRLAAARDAAIVPWGWGLNGATSVLGSVGALALAILFGFANVLFIGAAVYLVAAVTMLRLRD